VLLHLSDTERLFCFRALWFARGEQAPLPGMEPDPWAARSDANARDLRDLLAEFEHVRAASVSLFASLDTAAWMQQGTASDPAQAAELAALVPQLQVAHIAGTGHNIQREQPACYIEVVRRPIARRPRLWRPQPNGSASRALPSRSRRRAAKRTRATG
jgi:pimeloyl-ACP methyl ester carboxylesterase